MTSSMPTSAATAQATIACHQSNTVQSQGPQLTDAQRFVFTASRDDEYAAGPPVPADRAAVPPASPGRR